MTFTQAMICPNIEIFSEGWFPKTIDDTSPGNSQSVAKPYNDVPAFLLPDLSGTSVEALGLRPGSFTE